MAAATEAIRVGEADGMVKSGMGQRVKKHEEREALRAASCGKSETVVDRDS